MPCNSGLRQCFCGSSCALRRGDSAGHRTSDLAAILHWASYNTPKKKTQQPAVNIEPVLQSPILSSPRAEETLTKSPGRPKVQCFHPGIQTSGRSAPAVRDATVRSGSRGSAASIKLSSATSSRASNNRRSKTWRWLDTYLLIYLHMCLQLQQCTLSRRFKPTSSEFTEQEMLMENERKAFVAKPDSFSHKGQAIQGPALPIPTTSCVKPSEHSP